MTSGSETPGAARPMKFDSYSSPEEQTLLRSANERLGHFAPRLSLNRLIVTEAVAAGLCVLLAAALAVLSPQHVHLQAVHLIIVIGAYLLAMRVRFPVASGWTRPTQIVFVPMLFLIPDRFVPAVVLLCLVLDLWPEVREHQLTPGLVLARIADGAYALGPALVLVLDGNPRFSWSVCRLLVVAFAAQIAIDAGAGVTRGWFAEGIVPRLQMPMAWVYLVDLCLGCAGLVFAEASDRGQPWVLLLALPMVALLGIFARERQERFDQTLQLSSAYRGTAMLLANVVEIDNAYTGLHSRQVVDLSLEVARRLGLDASQRLGVEFGALLHDVGKIRVPSAIIDKPGKLDESEWEIIRQHTIYGQEMLEQVGGTLARVGQIVRSSHENYDGTGYPDRLAADAIPIESRIVTACDAYNAMTTTRSYRPGMTPEAARAELQRCAGTQFDPAVVAAVLAASE